MSQITLLTSTSLSPVLSKPAELFVNVPQLSFVLSSYNEPCQQHRRDCFLHFRANLEPPEGKAWPWPVVLAASNEGAAPPLRQIARSPGYGSKVAAFSHLSPFSSSVSFPPFTDLV